MWESRVLFEISKALWKPFCGFQGAVICIAIFGIIHDRAERGDAVPLPACRSSFLEAPTRSLRIGRPRKRSEAVDFRRGHVRHMVLLRRLLSTQVGLDFGAPAFGAALEHVRVVQESIEQRRDRRGVTQEFAPIVDRSV